MMKYYGFSKQEILDLSLIEYSNRWDDIWKIEKLFAGESIATPAENLNRAQTAAKKFGIKPPKA